MKGCSLSCLIHLALWAVLGGAFYFHLRQFGEITPELWWASAGASLFATLIVGQIQAIYTASKERRALLNAMVGQPLVDGEWVAVSGPIRAHQPLPTPLSDQPAVAYEYDIYRMERHGKSSSKVSYWEGKAVTPSTIAARQGAVRLLSVPSLDVKTERPDSRTAFDNAARYIARTAFQTRQTPKEHRVGMSEEMADDDGAFRVDKQKSHKQDVELESCSLQEKYVKQGETVCAFGLYSSARGGIVPHPNWAKQTRLMIGDATVVSAQLRTRIIRYCIGIVCFAALAVGIAKFYERHAATRSQETSSLSQTKTPLVSEGSFS